MKSLALAGLALVLTWTASWAGATNQPAGGTRGAFDPTSAYDEREMLGWRVRVNEKLRAEPNLCERTLQRLEAQLIQVTNAVPAAAVEQLRTIPIWVERASPQFWCMCYHESSEWLRTHNVNPDKTGGVELANPENFLTGTREQPWMVLHELAHGYHQRFLGENQADLRHCYEAAQASGQYQSVAHVQGGRHRHYALTNAKEYFAEATEAFFGTNDFQPFTRAQLREFDPAMHQLLFKLWTVPGQP